MASHLWECPEGLHPAVRGPSRPRRENLVRYCIPCSEGAGKLVERRCPAVERKRAARSASVKERRDRKVTREREKEADRMTVDGLRLDQEMKRMCRMKSLGGPKGSLARRPPNLVVRRGTWGTTGHAKGWRNEIVLTIGPNCSRERAAELLLHELVHRRTLGHGPPHGTVYKKALIKAVSERWPRLAFDRDEAHGAYVIDRSIVQALLDDGRMRNDEPE